MTLVMPLFALIIVLFGLVRRVPVFDLLYRTRDHGADVRCQPAARKRRDGSALPNDNAACRRDRLSCRDRSDGAAPTRFGKRCDGAAALGLFGLRPRQLRRKGRVCSGRLERNHLLCRRDVLRQHPRQIYAAHASCGACRGLHRSGDEHCDSSTVFLLISMKFK